VLHRLRPTLEVIEAASCEQARASLSGSAFDLVLLDYLLPDSHGHSGLLELLPLAGAAPIVLLSSECDGELVRATLALGVRGFIPKTSSAEVMLAAIGVVLSGGTYVPVDALTEPGGSTPAGDTALTERQRAVLQLVVDGKTNREIANSLGTSESTVRVHLTAIFRTLGVGNRTQACSVALRHQIVRKSSP
jgi:DNA-binding NarL/FixJ family response regulator